MKHDQYMKEFLDVEGFAPTIHSEAVSEKVLQKYQGKLSSKLLSYWQQYGFCGYAEGLFWTVNPEDYEDILEQYLKSTPLYGLDNYYVIARTAFGDLYIQGSCSNDLTIIHTQESLLFPADIEQANDTERARNRVIEIFFEASNKESFDAYDQSDKPMFQKALQQLGPLSADEMYGFVPALAIGGKAELKSLKKVPILEHLSFLSQLEPLTIMKSINEFLGDDL